MKWPPKSIGYKKAIEKMRQPGTRMIRQYTRQSRDGYAHFVVPGGYVEPEVAQKIKDHPQIVGGKDGFFPGHDQTWTHMNHLSKETSQ
jgi:hypothetical protein